VRILHVIDLLAPVGGAQRYVHDVLALLDGAGHEVAVLHGDDVAHEQLDVAAERYSATRVKTWISSFGPEVVHVHETALPSGLEAALREFPVVHSLHSFSFGCASGTKYFRDGRICSRPHGAGCLVTGLARGCSHRLDLRPVFSRYRRIERELPALRDAARCITHSRFMRSVAAANRLPAERLEVVPYFTYRPVGSAAPCRDRTIAFAGRIVADKGLDVLIEALASCQNVWNRFLVAGDGWDRDRCTRLTRSCGIGSKVDFLGHLDVKGVRQAFSLASIVAVPSRWPEPFGIVGLEAMALARPVVASGVGGIPEWLDDGRTGLLVPPGDASALAAALVRLLDDPDRATAFGLEGRRRVERFSPESHLRQLVAVYARAAGRTQEAQARTRLS
jgi:glycosyltransferase involved in cell wall biosynthesis